MMIFNTIYNGVTLIKNKKTIQVSWIVFLFLIFILHFSKLSTSVDFQPVRISQ